MNLNKVITTAIYNKLYADTTLKNLINDTTIGVKIWYGAAPPKLESAFPYVLISLASGGILNDAPYDAADITMMVTGVAKTKPDAETIAGYIQTDLRHQVLTYSDGWVSNSTVRQEDSFSRFENVQNAQYHQEGAYYRFRLSKG